MLSLLLLGILAASRAASPGLKFEISTTSLRYLTDVAVAAIEDNLKDVAVPDVRSPPDFLNYKVQNIKMEAFRVPHEDVVVIPEPGSGITIKTQKAYIGLRGDYSMNFGPWMHKNGQVTVRLSDFAISLKLHLGMSVGSDGRGRLAVSTSACKASVSKVDLSFSGDLFNKFINAFKALIDLSMKGDVQDMICVQIKQDVDNKLNNFLHDQSMRIPLGKTGVLLDAALTRSPIIRQSRFEVDIRGQSSLAGHKIPFNPAPLPSCPAIGRMVHFMIDEQVPNALLEAVTGAGLLEITIDKALLNRLSPDNAHYLNVSCSSTAPHPCLGMLFASTIGKKFGNTSMVIGIKQISAPNVTFNATGNTAVINVNVNLDIQSQFKNQSIIPIMNLDVSVGIIIQNTKLHTVNASEYLLTIDNLKTTLSHTVVNSANFNETFAQFVPDTVQAVIASTVPQVLPTLQKGVKIPGNGMFQLRNTAIQLFNRAMFLAFDARITL